MGYHGSIGDGADRAGAASVEPSAAPSYGRYQKAFGCRLSAWNGPAAFGPGKVQIVSRPRSVDRLSRIRPWGWTRLMRLPPVIDGVSGRITRAFEFVLCELSGDTLRSRGRVA